MDRRTDIYTSREAHRTATYYRLSGGRTDWQVSKYAGKQDSYRQTDKWMEGQVGSMTKRNTKTGPGRQTYRPNRHIQL